MRYPLFFILLSLVRSNFLTTYVGVKNLNKKLGCMSTPNPLIIFIEINNLTFLKKLVKGLGSKAQVQDIYYYGHSIIYLWFVF